MAVGKKKLHELDEIWSQLVRKTEIYSTAGGCDELDRLEGTEGIYMSFIVVSFESESLLTYLLRRELPQMVASHILTYFICGGDSEGFPGIYPAEKLNVVDGDQKLAVCQLALWHEGYV